MLTGTLEFLLSLLVTSGSSGFRLFIEIIHQVYANFKIEITSFTVADLSCVHIKLRAWLLLLVVSSS